MTTTEPTSQVMCSIPETHESHSLSAWFGKQKLMMVCSGEARTTNYVSAEADRWRRMNQLAQLMVEWAEGRRSMNNEFMAVEADPQRRLETLVAIAQADAAEVQKLSAAVQALIALDGRTR